MSAEMENAIEVLTEAMQDSGLGSYAHSWHCSISTSVYDECISHGIAYEDARRIGNAAATRFMKLFFDVDTKGE